MEPLTIFIIIAAIIIFISVRQINQYERGVVLTLGKYSGMREPGITLILPIIQSMSKIDIRMKAEECNYAG
jgi:regulator of protease activity HflC (stomatin/prohibitin superfamily)